MIIGDLMIEKFVNYLHEPVCSHCSAPLSDSFQEDFMVGELEYECPECGRNNIVITIAEITYKTEKGSFVCEYCHEEYQAKCERYITDIVKKRLGFEPFSPICEDCASMLKGIHIIL